MKSIKEKQLLVKWSRAMSMPIDQGLLEEVERYEKLQQEIVESVRKNNNEFIDALKPVETLQKNNVITEVVDSNKEELHELVQTLPFEKPTDTTEASTTPSPTLAQRAAEFITKEVKLEERSDSYQQPDVDTPRSLNDIKKKIKFLEDWISKVSLAGPGGGAGDILNLDIPTKVVTGDYTVTRYDYYVGVNCTSKANITLPSPSTIKNGREVIIKDESGRAQLNPIKVLGTVDNDTGGFEIRINNGAVQLVYRDGWRII
jgi:hypothetical protein